MLEIFQNKGGAPLLPGYASIIIDDDGYIYDPATYNTLSKTPIGQVDDATGYVYGADHTSVYRKPLGQMLLESDDSAVIYGPDFNKPDRQPLYIINSSGIYTYDEYRALQDPNYAAAVAAGASVFANGTAPAGAGNAAGFAAGSPAGSTAGISSLDKAVSEAAALSKDKSTRPEQKDASAAKPTGRSTSSNQKKTGKRSAIPIVALIGLIAAGSVAGIYASSVSKKSAPAAQETTVAKEDASAADTAADTAAGQEAEEKKETAESAKKTEEKTASAASSEKTADSKTTASTTGSSTGTATGTGTSGTAGTTSGSASDTTWSSQTGTQTAQTDAQTTPADAQAAQTAQAQAPVQEKQLTPPEELQGQPAGYRIMIASADGYVNMRAGCSGEYPVVYPKIPSGTNLDISEVIVNDAGVVWGKTTFEGFTGWIFMDPVLRAGEADLPATQKTVTVASANGGVVLRNGAGNEFAVKHDWIPTGTSLPVYRTKTLSNGETWGFTFYGGWFGWVCLNETV